MRRLVPALIVSISIAGCSEGPEVLPASAAEIPAIDDETRQRITREIQGAVEAWVRVAARLNETSSFATFSSSPEALVAWEGEAMDIAGYRTFWVEAVADLSGQEFADLNTRVQVITPQVAISTSTAAWSRTNSQGGQSPPAAWTATAAWVREAGEWKAINLHQSIAGEMPPIQ